ncbi:thymidine phosphorylase [Falsirhodobacter halotolerans]|uniref:thymidine phosphorylase n=1 Tax=Falsirhodobacter halotolerans TaxID=1146892 RepID=UPI001FCFD38C|nr:thymidine phosphorylase [Falsirhodobacter halotolerans]MCJ8138899.1 thymidine phosphorylase [Falsirhodobacter halotolerans]
MDLRAFLSGLRQGQEPEAAALAEFAAGLASGAVSDAQAGAFAMAVCQRGLSDGARVALMRGMRDSGRVMEWDLPGPVLDKHSTGGVGDCVSLLLAPALVACGAYVPMISGRGLGHTGGTLDKLEAIPGFRVAMDEQALRRQMETTRVAIVAASDTLAPADRRLYAIRDLTGTVESLDLITSSILSKKLAAGLEGLVLDVKVGSGAFMKTMEEAEALARALVTTAQGAGCMATALITDMNQPLATAAGNALEVAEVMETITGVSVNMALWEVTVALGGEALALGGLAADALEGEGRIAEALESGRAAEYFARMVAAQGGPADFVERWPDRLPAAAVMLEVPSPATGHIHAIDTEALGRTVLALGAGRQAAGGRVNPSVGLSDLAAIGEEVEVEVPLAMVHAATLVDAERAVAAVQRAYRLAPAEPDETPLIRGRVA